MKILEMHIYGFGQLNDVKMKDLTDFQVFYGENEAGKSTINAFIHGILFGFPTKQQSSELRYEPKHVTKYGGKLRIYHQELGYAVIERVKGKASGDVTVTLDGGTVGGEELLTQLLSRIDKGLFQAIFSFNLQGLQNIHQMKGEELGKFLFSAGTLGTERLAKTEAELQRELETRFKPSGKKPLLNEKLKVVHEINGELKKAAAKNQQYELHVKEKELLQQEIENINNCLYEFQDKMEKLNEWKKIHLFVKEEKWTKTEIDKIGACHFPERGIERLEKLNQLIYPYNARIESLVERITLLEKELETIQPDHQFLDNEPAIATLLDQVPLYEQLNLEKQRCETKLIEMIEKIALINEKLHLSLKEEEVLTINTNMVMKNQVELVSRKSQRLIEAKAELEVKFKEEKDSLEDLEEKVQFIESQLITSQERATLEKKITEANSKKNVEIELTAIQDKIEFYRQANERDKNTFAKLHKQKRTQFFTIEFILLFLSLYSLLTKQWVLLWVGLIGCLLIGIFMSRSLRPADATTSNQTLDQLSENEKNLIQKLKIFDTVNSTLLLDQLNSDNQRREQLKIAKMKLEQQHNQFEKILSKFEAWEVEAAENKEKTLKVSSELKIPEYIADAFLLEAFQLIEQYKLVEREKRQLLSRLEDIQHEQDTISNNLNVYAGEYLVEKNYDLQKTAYLLRTKLKEDNEKRIKNQEKQAKLTDLEADLQQIKQEHAHLKKERAKLLKEANAASVDQFYELANKTEKKRKLISRLEDLTKQLQYTLLKENEWESFLQIHNADELISRYGQEVQTLSAQLVMLHEKHAAVKYEIQVLEEGGVYSELLHQFKQKKFELEEDAKEWAVYSLAQEILSKTIEKYKNIYLPRMLSKAEEYLFFLTDGVYHRIHLRNSGTGFLIERNDHTLFEANELSQATTEQVYVSIRLALATTLYEKYRFPIIIDDSFANFDARRTEKVLQLLKQLDQNQIFFFTCHTHLLKYFQQENVISLNNSAVKVI